MNNEDGGWTITLRFIILFWEIKVILWFGSCILYFSAGTTAHYFVYFSFYICSIWFCQQMEPVARLRFIFYFTEILWFLKRKTLEYVGVYSSHFCVYSSRYQMKWCFKEGNFYAYWHLNVSVVYSVLTVQYYINDPKKLLLTCTTDAPKRSSSEKNKFLWIHFYNKMKAILYLLLTSGRKFTGFHIYLFYLLKYQSQKKNECF